MPRFWRRRIRSDKATAAPETQAPSGQPNTGDSETHAPSDQPARTPPPGHIRRVVDAGAKPFGLSGLALVSVLVGAWGGIVPYIGPTFGYRSNAMGSWDWNLQHSLLYLLPGAVAVTAGLLMFSAAAQAARTGARFGAGLLGLVTFCCGAWFILGPVAWPVFYSTPVFGAATSAQAGFVNQLGYNLGPGIVLIVASGMALATAATRNLVRPVAAPLDDTAQESEPAYPRSA